MANQIGDQQFLTMRGTPAPPGEIPEVLPPAPGENYDRWRQIGKRAEDAPIECTVLCADAATAAALGKTYMAKQSLDEDVIDAFGNTYLNCLIRRVRFRIIPVIEGGVSKYLLYSTWIVRQGQEE